MKFTKPISTLFHLASIALLASAFVLPGLAGAQIAVVGSTVEEHNAAPGQSYEGTILVRNLTTTPQSVRIYKSDYLFFANGTSHFDDPATTPRSNANWVKPSASSIVVPPSGEIVVGYTISVPMADTLRGTYWSAIMVEGAPSAPPAAASKQVGIGAVVRYAVQLATHLPTAGSRKVVFENNTLATDSTGHRVLELDVLNSGERAYRPKLWAELYDAAGVLRGRSEQQRGLLFPGTSLKQRFVFDVLPAGSYKAVVFADSGDDSVFAAQYKLVF
ncbi:MAG: hypothetical protein ABIY52_05825 [Gemmatimonadaceae bacterium]